MIFRQLFDSVSGTYSYILASRKSGCLRTTSAWQHQADPRYEAFC